MTAPRHKPSAVQPLRVNLLSHRAMLASLAGDEENAVDAYEKASYGELPVGFGEKPGIVVIDFQICYTDSKYPFGGAPLMMRALDNTAKLLEVARRANVPVANCYTAYMNKREMPYWKISVLYDLLRHDNPAAELDPRAPDALPSTKGAL